MLRLAPKGGSVALAEGVEVRVPGGVPGDRGVLRIVHTGKNAVWGKVHDLTVPSPDRVSTFCDVVDRCGGCPWQSVSAEAQRRARLAGLEAALGDLLDGARRHPWAGPVADRGFRTRALMMARKHRGRLRLGFFAPGTNDLVPAERCPVQDARIGTALEEVRFRLHRRRVTTWEGAGSDGLLKAALLRMDPAVGAGLLTLVVTRDDESLPALARELVGIPGVAGVHANVNPADGGPVLGPETRHLAGARYQEVRYGSLALQIGPTAFLQTNHAVALALLEVVAGLTPGRMAHLADLYAGVGVFGLALSRRAERVTLVERSPAAVADARRNAARLGAEHVTVLEADAAEVAADLPGPPPDAVVLDPPRSGCGPAVVDAIAALPGRPRVIYVSCGPKGLARDARRLVEAGFRVTDLVPLDMFPHTPHVEALVALERAS
ncbi:MAG: 23S rRNA (uracil(1939)-C(5))-methyltransferase RlmD [Myxococcota bacterium]